VISKKGQAKRALFWPLTARYCQMGFALGFHGLKPGFAWFQTQDKPAKNRVYFLTTLTETGEYVEILGYGVRIPASS
jgi:hypothetical protein